MTGCPVCGGAVGIVRVRYHDGAPDAFGVCFCPAGLQMRNTTNGATRTAYPLWMLWAAREQVDPTQVAMVEELLTDAELATIPLPGTVPATSIAAAMRTQKGKL